MNFNNSIDNLNYISTINLNNESSYDQIFHVLEKTILLYNIVTLRKGAYLFRARQKNEEDIVKSRSDLSYRTDIKNITEFGRANIPYQSMFYAAHKTETAVFETSSLIRDNRKDIKIEKLILGRWFVNNDIKLLAIITNPDAIQKNKELQHLNGIIQFDSFNVNQKIKWMLDYFSKEFAKNALGNHNNYKVSAAYYNLMQIKNKEIQGIMYPSVGFEFEDINIALLPKIVDSSLVLDMIGEYLVDFNYNPRRITQTGFGDVTTFNIREINY